VAAAGSTQVVRSKSSVCAPATECFSFREDKFFGPVSDAPDLLDVEISIVNHGSRDVTKACLLSLPSACRGLNWHVTVVDNASTDGSVEMLRTEFPDVTLVCNREPHGFGFNHNQVVGPVVESGTARYVLVLNNDTELAVESVTRMVAHADHHPRHGAVGPRTLNPDGTLQPSSFRFPRLGGAVLSEVYPRAAALGCAAAESGEIWLGGACLLLRTAALREVGLFDQRFFLFFEDIDLSRRLRDKGWLSSLCPEALMMHHNHNTIDRDELRFAMACQLRRSYFLYLSKHHGRAAALGLVTLGRLALLARAAGESIGARSPRSEAQRRKIALLRGLGRYDPRRPLSHELAVR
jgi:N-acetylglucosaminyl-diphospho-decaprenol L-rhamnosyltransferase